ncbi:MAG: hypothetical protein PVI35_08265, partial [Acidimicrobiia bacterium]
MSDVPGVVPAGLELTPALVLAMWTAGMAALAALVAWWRIVGPGFGWLMAAVILLFGAGLAAATDDRRVVVALLLVTAAGVAARRPLVTAGCFLAGALVLGAVAAADSPLVPVMTGALFLGGVTVEMVLGHWYLVDPRLPRWALQVLAAVGGAGLAAETVVLVTAGALGSAQTGTVWAFAALTATTGLLVVAVSFSLRERGYAGVMAATGLSYLAV